jgi:Trk-type K+ transport system membrane component
MVQSIQRPTLRTLAIIAALPAVLALQGCVAMAVGGAAVGVAGAVVGTTAAVTVGAARVGGHVVASGVRATTGSGRHHDEEPEQH